MGEDADDNVQQPMRVAVFAPSPIVTVTVESLQDELAEVHIHAGGQGVWTARMIRRLGASVVLCSALGGETGMVLRALIAQEGFELRDVGSETANGAYIHDRREGERDVVAETSAGPLSRHDLDALYGAMFVAAVDAGTCVLTGNVPSVVPTETYRRFAADLAHNDVDVVVDTSGACLAAALRGGPALVKISHEELIRDGYATDSSPEELRRGIERLQHAGARDVVVSRAGEPVLASMGGQLLTVDCPEVEVVDPRGGGDAMTAALAVARAERRSNERALCLAVAAATLTITRHGLATGGGEDVERLATALSAGPIPDSTIFEEASP
ncbi:MAG TPA: PfkB family carbohydrate kinase [Acidimicrobiia bacterium]|nr:PfkB family carbohydrate kinase [Acidimicrobiia bacterium]